MNDWKIVPSPMTSLASIHIVYKGLAGSLIQNKVTWATVIHIANIRSANTFWKRQPILEQLAALFNKEIKIETLHNIYSREVTAYRYSLSIDKIKLVDTLDGEVLFKALMDNNKEVRRFATFILKERI